MPRLTNYDYLLIYAHLHRLWENKRQGFRLISTKDQYYLHAFFRPSEQLTEAELLAHRKAITTKYPSLPHKAGRALKHFANPAPLKRAPVGSKCIVVYPLVRPQPDIKLLAQAMIATARRLAENEERK